jgi:predicted acetyltransferase
VVEVLLEAAAPGDAGLLANLLELYIHDLSEVFPVELGADGRFGYETLPGYWSEPDRRFPFLIRLGGRLAGFVLVTRGVLPSNDPDVFDIAEFFVLRRFRRLGVARRAAFLVWDRFPGRWTVRVSEGKWRRRSILDARGDRVHERHRGRIDPPRDATRLARVFFSERH